MGKNSLVLKIILILFPLYSQSQALKNSFGLVVSNMSMRSSKFDGINYAAQYALCFPKKFNLINFKIGYLIAKAPGINNYNIMPKFNSTDGTCATVDINIAHDFLKHLNHTLRLGVGPSIWFINNVYETPTIKVVKFLNITHVVSVIQEKAQGVSFGYNTELAYEYTFNSGFMLSSHFSYVYTKQLKESFIVGLSVGYQYK